MSQKGSPVKPERSAVQLFLEENIANYTGQRLTIVPPNVHTGPLPRISKLALDNNDIKKLDNVTTYPSLIELTASHNKIFRMYQLSSLKHLVHLDLSFNQVTTMEGLKDMTHLTYLDLSHNKIKVIDSIMSNQYLDYVDLSHNNISAICNISKLTKLKTLLLHENQLSSLKHCGVYLPGSLTTLTLADNKISDLNEVSHLAGLAHLKELSIASNPCVQMTGSDVPFLINWCNFLKSIDGYAVDDIERLKGEWLYSQGRGRQFRPGQHSELVTYLVDECPLHDETLQTENERKLRLILSKAHQHQSQLRMAEGPAQATASSMSQKSRFSDLMTQSLDPSLLDSCSSKTVASRRTPVPQQDHSLTRSLHFEVRSSKDIEPACSMASASAPLPAASKLVPVPESLISPMVTNTPPLVIQGAPSITKDPVSASKLQTIKSAAEKKKVRRSQGSDKEHAAIIIQRMWRGYRTRHLNTRVVNLYSEMHRRRNDVLIQRLTEDVAATRAVMEGEHKLRILQMQAINALWRKVLNFPSAINTDEVLELRETCERLTNQVEQLQICMQEVRRNIGPSSSTTMATQTDIVAVHTPNEEGADSRLLLSRPSTLPIPRPQVSHYADSLVEELFDETVGDGSLIRDEIVTDINNCDVGTPV